MFREIYDLKNLVIFGSSLTQLQAETDTMKNEELELRKDVAVAVTC